MVIWGGLSIDKKPARITNTLIANNQLKNTNQFYYQTQGAGIHTEIIEVQYNKLELAILA